MTPLDKKVIKLAWPIILANIFVPLLGLVDTAVIGHLDQAYYLGGVALGGMAISTLFWLAGFLRMSTSGLAAYAYGQGDLKQLWRVIVQGIILALIIALLLGLLTPAITHLLLPMIGSSEPVLEYAQQYFSIRIWGAPAALINLVALGWLLGIQKSQHTFTILIFANLLNIALDLVFVLLFLVLLLRQFM